MMNYEISLTPKTLHFKQPAGTSRGIYTERRVWYLEIRDEAGNIGVGECAPLPGLSCDYDFIVGHDNEYLLKLIRQANFIGGNLLSFPSLRFALETAVRHLQSGGNATLGFDTDFSRGNAGIVTNGLIWMGDFETMKKRIREKIDAGFHCLKLKIGALDFERELELIRDIRREFAAGTLTLRVDANGAFAPQDALQKLERLAKYDLHSIEQPIRAGQYEAMAELCAKSPVPVALDEELIGINMPVKKRRLVEALKPQFLVLKPSLHGGMAGCEQWAQFAQKNNAGWWVTSALESNVGLNAIAQWAASLDNPLPQGLGLGNLFSDNTPSRLQIRGERLYFEP
ncbi:MAG: o-succinylbenzoate synthase [Opitutales bacterium]|nr:o-succinylbenzoate synthase [Opitutales bacterium]